MLPLPTMLACGVESIRIRGELLLLYIQCLLATFNANVYCRWDMSLQLGAAGLQRRTLDSIKDRAQPAASDKDKNPYGCIHPPLLNVQPDCIVVDELHLLLRISDRLIDNLVARAAELDLKCRDHGIGEPNNLSRLQQAISGCGVYFKVKQSCL